MIQMNKINRVSRLLLVCFHQSNPPEPQLLYMCLWVCPFFSLLVVIHGPSLGNPKPCRLHRIGYPRLMSWVLNWIKREKEEVWHSPVFASYPWRSEHGSFTTCFQGHPRTCCYASPVMIHCSHKLWIKNQTKQKTNIPFLNCLLLGIWS